MCTSNEKEKINGQKMENTRMEFKTEQKKLDEARNK